MDRGSEMVSKYCTSQNDMAIQFHDYKHELWIPTDFSSVQQIPSKTSNTASQ